MKTKKAEMGIGTLIIFIAMILVAAIAAGVLIQTQTSLQSQALLTGERSKEQVGTSLLALEVSASDGSDQNVETFYETVKLSPGSSDVRLSDVLLSVETDSQIDYLSYGGTNVSEDASGDGDGTAGYYTNSSNVGYYTIEYLIGGSNPGYIQAGDVVKLYFKSSNAVEEDKAIRVSLVPKIGTPLVLNLATPGVMTDSIEQIYP